MKGRVLVIDDEPAVGRTMQRLLGKTCDVTTLSNGHAAIGLLRGGEEFDVILCDLSMPEMSGVVVFETVVAMRPDLAPRFVFLSGDIHSSRTREFLGSIPNAKIDKPFDLETVRAIVRARLLPQGAALESIG